MKESEARPQRPRRAPTRLDNGGDTAALQQAIRNSLVQQRRAEASVPSAPVFHPTMQEFCDPLAYISRIRSAAEPYGIAKVVPPAGWHQAFADPLASCAEDFETKQQRINHLQEGQPFGEGARYTLPTYRAMAEAFKTQWLAEHPVPADLSEEEFIEREYWRTVEGGDEQVTVDYANDLDTGIYGSGFAQSPDAASDCGWDLNRLNENPENVLRAVGSCLPGVTRPWLYVGMLFATFCWHKEDHNLYSINFLHHGASKSWYGVPGAAASRFERALRHSVPRLFDEAPDLLHRITTLISPAACAEHGVGVVKITQRPGEFIITFPAAFHAGFSHGFNCGEAVNVADAHWLPFGRAAVEDYRKGLGQRDALFAHERLVWMLQKTCSPNAPRAQLLRVPEHAQQVVRAELAVAVKEQLHFRKWLRQHNVADSPLLESEANDAECEVCGTVPFFAVVRCACNASRIACPQHGLALCECAAAHKTLELRLSDEDMHAALAECGHAAGSPAASPADKQPKRPRNEPVAALGGGGAPRDAEPGPKSARCCECGGHAGRGGLMRCMGCDAAFHRKCADRDLHLTDVCLCPACWDAQQ